MPTRASPSRYCPGSARPARRPPAPAQPKSPSRPGRPSWARARAARLRVARGSMQPATAFQRSPGRSLAFMVVSPPLETGRESSTVGTQAKSHTLSGNDDAATDPRLRDHCRHDGAVRVGPAALRPGRRRWRCWPRCSIGVVPADKAFSGFSDDIVIIVAGALIVSAAVARSGIIEAGAAAARAARHVRRARRSSSWSAPSRCCRRS